jgi:hypothetical protein
MNIDQIEKELNKYQKLVTNLDREIASNEGKLESILEQIKKDFHVESIQEADILLEEMKQQVNLLEIEVEAKMKDLNDKYGHLC